MKKRILALILSTVMACGLMMTGCGGSSEAPAAPAETEAAPAEADAPAETEAAPEEAAADTADTASTSGEITFADIQDNYALLTDAYNAVVDAYNDDSIKQSDEVESDINQAKELMDELGNLSETDFKSQDDYVTMNNAILDMCTVLNSILDKMEPAE